MDQTMLHIVLFATALSAATVLLGSSEVALVAALPLNLALLQGTFPFWRALFMAAHRRDYSVENECAASKGALGDSGISEAAGPRPRAGDTS
jgi:hypothetical protein